MYLCYNFVNVNYVVKNPQLDSAIEGDPRSRRTGGVVLGWKDDGEADVWGWEDAWGV